MKKIKKVSKLPLILEPDTVYYSRLLREIILITNQGSQRFQALYAPKYPDAFSVAGYFPLYATQVLANTNSPISASIAYGEAELGPEPAGVTYPVYMPAGIPVKYLGNYINPIEDDDGDGVLNFRDPDLIGLPALLDAGYEGVDPYTSPSNVTLNIRDFSSNPDSGTYNDTGSEIIVPIAESGFMIGPNGEKTFFFGPGAAIIPPAFILFQDQGLTGSSLPNPVPAYTGDPFVTSSGTEVNIENYLDEPSSGSLNNTQSTINVNTIHPGILVGPNGEIKYFLPGNVTIPADWVLFEELSGETSPLPWSGYTKQDPFTTSGGANINIKDYLDDPDGGSINNTGQNIEIEVTEKCILVLPDGTVTEVGPGDVTMPPGSVLFSEESKLIKKAVSSGLIDEPTFPPTASSTSRQFFETSNGDLVLRNAAYDSSDPAVQLWEASGDDYIPRDEPFSSNTDDAQYFEINLDGDILPKEDSTVLQN